MVKKLISIVVVLVMALAMLTACTDSDMQKRMAELEANAQKQADKIKDLEEDLQSKSDKIKGLEEDLQNKSDKLKDLEDKNDELKGQIEELEDIIIELGGDIGPTATLYFLDEAYEQGWLTEEDIMNISYLMNGVVIKATKGQDRSEWEIIEFTPTISITEIDPKLKRDIQNAIYKMYKEEFDECASSGEKYSAKDIPVDYYGSYNGTHIVRIDLSFMGYAYTDNEVRTYVGGFVIPGPHPAMRALRFI